MAVNTVSTAHTYSQADHHCKSFKSESSRVMGCMDRWADALTEASVTLNKL